MFYLAQVAGCGKPVLLVHGFGASLGHWRKNVPALAQTHKVRLHPEEGVQRESGREGGRGAQGKDRGRWMVGEEWGIAWDGEGDREGEGERLGQSED